MIATTILPTRAELLIDLAHREAMRIQRRTARRADADAATARLAAELSQERATIELHLAAVAARLAIAAARCEQHVVSMYAQR